MAKQEVMTMAGFKQLLKEYSNEVTNDFQVWLSSDEEGNEFLPMLKKPEYSLAIDTGHKRIVLFPSHW
jgi:hypothetical protein